MDLAQVVSDGAVSHRPRCLRGPNIHKTARRANVPLFEIATHERAHDIILEYASAKTGRICVYDRRKLRVPGDGSLIGRSTARSGNDHENARKYKLLVSPRRSTGTPALEYGDSARLSDRRYRTYSMRGALLEDDPVAVLGVRNLKGGTVPNGHAVLDCEAG